MGSVMGTDMGWDVVDVMREATGAEEVIVNPKPVRINNNIIITYDNNMYTITKTNSNQLEMEILR